VGPERSSVSRVGKKCSLLEGGWFVVGKWWKVERMVERQWDVVSRGLGRRSVYASLLYSIFAHRSRGIACNRYAQLEAL